jgi:Cdc6-like AAA superfamily ATPase
MPFVHDEEGNIKSNGFLSLSTRGSDIIDSRRTEAKKRIENPNNLVLESLYFAIEGKPDFMRSCNRHRITPTLTQKTRDFLKMKFGIDNLTVNQEEAVDIAINTPDIAIIQGPPGTGKTTVLSAICYRLAELAEKEKDENKNKLFLVSAFQNDTVEHIASQIEILGLPTLKIGKKENSVSPEDSLIGRIRNTVDENIQKLSPSEFATKTISTIYKAKRLV